MPTRIGKGGSGVDPVKGFTLVPEDQEFGGLYVCDACGWHVLAVDVDRHGGDRSHPCLKKAGQVARDLAARLPGVAFSQHGHGYGVVNFTVDEDLHVTFNMHKDGTFDLREVWYLNSMNADRAEALVKLIAEWGK